MTPERRQQIEERWTAIDKELASIFEAEVVPGVDDLARREGELLEEQDALEFELGEAYFEERDGEGKSK